ncbi:hypothetical protein CJ97_gp52 [Ralstonia phage RSB2]|uniref:Uncharacterized protein ORF52 n=1 Tax=Ralstonia phage RSB2 TaxID=913183 RepID=E5RV32_9CAUD|nr:hypothetical protein CJ97_gp52 [Ralstonia phage RSB2]BAJ51840.1 hypothetical protein [Ralstonia phage RSB2]
MDKLKAVALTVVKARSFWALVAVVAAGLGFTAVPAGTLEAVGCALAGGCV